MRDIVKTLSKGKSTKEVQPNFKANTVVKRGTVPLLRDA